MTRRQRRAAERYLRQLADLLRLRDWTVVLAEEPSKAGVSATVQPIYGRRLANVFLAEDHFERPPEEQRHTLTHELIHLHLEPCSSMVLGDLYTALGRKTDAVFERVYMRHMEYAVDALADAVAPLLPLPALP